MTINFSNIFKEIIVFILENTRVNINKENNYHNYEYSKEKTTCKIMIMQHYVNQKVFIEMCYNWCTQFKMCVETISVICIFSLLISKIQHIKINIIWLYSYTSSFYKLIISPLHILFWLITSVYQNILYDEISFYKYLVSELGHKLRCPIFILNGNSLFFSNLWVVKFNKYTTNQII